MKYEIEKVSSEGLEKVKQLVSDGFKIISYGLSEIVLQKVSADVNYFSGFSGDENDCSEGYGFAGI